MVQFYTGGLDNGVPSVSQDAIATICKVIKAHHYQKVIKNTLDSYDFINKCFDPSTRTQKSTVYSLRTMTMNDVDKNPKSMVRLNECESSEAAIKRKLIENKESKS
jgi:hypothetical protein